jgi:hypothetical protein
MMPSDDLDSLFGHDEAKRRREQRQADRVSAIESGRRLDEQDRILRERAKAAFVNNSEKLIRAEYRHHDLEPRPGALVSVTTLLSLGWTIREIENGKKVLVAPPTPEPYVDRRENS